MSSRSSSRPIVCAALLCAASLAPAGAQEPENASAPGLAAHPLEALDEVASQVVQQAAGSVVLIEVERPSYGVRQLTMRERNELGVVGGYDPRYFSRPEGPCSGVVVGPDQVVTARWNVDGDGAVSVVTPDGRRLPAKRLGQDENLDLALLSVEGLGLSPLPVASQGPVVGQFVMLVSRAPDQQVTCTQGTVAGLGRYAGDAIAHSARTSYEMAGGALVDLDGRLVAVSCRHGDKVRQGQVSGVGFAATVGKLQETLPAMARGEVIPRRQTPFLGIQADVEAVVKGVRIAQVIPGGAAQKAGIKSGDVIKIFNQVEINSFDQLREEIRSLTIGKEIVVTVIRGDQELDITVALGGRTEDE